MTNKHLLRGGGLDLNQTQLLIDFWKKYGKNIIRGVALTGATAGILSSKSKEEEEQQQLPYTIRRRHMAGGGFKEWWQKNKNYVYATGSGALALYGLYSGFNQGKNEAMGYRGMVDDMRGINTGYDNPVYGRGFIQTGKEKMRRGAKYIKENAKYIAPVAIATTGLLYFLINKGFPPNVANEIVNNHLEPEHIEHATKIIQNPYLTDAYFMALGGRGMKSIQKKHNIN